MKYKNSLENVNVIFFYNYKFIKEGKSERRES